jgi:hypothetical protein
MKRLPPARKPSGNLRSKSKKSGLPSIRPARFASHNRTKRRLMQWTDYSISNLIFNRFLKRADFAGIFRNKAINLSNSRFFAEELKVKALPQLLLELTSGRAV